MKWQRIGSRWRLPSSGGGGDEEQQGRKQAAKGALRQTVARFDHLWGPVEGEWPAGILDACELAALAVALGRLRRPAVQLECLTTARTPARARPRSRLDQRSSGLRRGRRQVAEKGQPVLRA
jgi:hypothetical protein